MQKIILIFVLLFSVLFTNIIGYAQIKDNGYVTDLNMALRLSKETQQKVVLIFSADWCGHCKTLKKDLPEIKEFDNKIICILDSDKEKKLVRQFKAKSLPTSVMLDSSGEEVSRKIGYDKKSYIKWLDNN